MDQMVSAQARVLRALPLENTASGIVRKRDGTYKIYYARRLEDGRTHLYSVLVDGTVSRNEEQPITFPKTIVDIIDPASLGIDVVIPRRALY